MLLLGILIGATGGICGMVFRSDADKLDRLAQGEGVLARWKYPPELWARYLAKEQEDETSSKTGLAVMVTVISLLIGGVFAIADPDTGPIVLGVLVGVCGLIWTLVLVLPGRRFRSGPEAREPEALVGRDGVYLAGEFHCWTSFGARLNRVVRADGEPGELVFDYQIMQRYGPAFYTVRVPVPAGEEGVADEVVARLSG